MQEQEPVLSLPAAVALCSLSGAMLSLCFPPAGLWFLAWVALVPWIVALRATTGARALLASWVGGMVFFGALLSWLNLFGFLPWLVAAAAEGFTLMLWGASQRCIGRMMPALQMLGAAALWCGLEWLRGLGAFGFTWGGLGYSQAPVLWLLPMARAAGTLGLSFAIVLANAALAELVMPSSPRHLRGRPLLGLAATAAVIRMASSPPPAPPRAGVSAST